MARISIIIPVYNVEEYVRQCLESVVAYEGDIEVVVVNDCSTDHSARIVQQFVERDSRVKMVQPSENVGLGRARNFGLAHSSGDYVLFLDSDDFYEPGALDAIATEIDLHEPDLVVFDYQRLYWNNKTQRNAVGYLLSDVGDVITLDDRPSLLKLLNVAWSKAYRREFLEQNQLEFPVGYYEDIPFTYVALPLARRIVLLDRVCVNYRQRRQGSILRTASNRHFEILEQIDRLFAAIEDRPAIHRWRGEIWDRAVSHVLSVLAMSSQRLPEGARREFFHAAAKCVARHMPVGHDFESGTRGRKARLLVKDDYVLFSSYVNGARVRNGLRRRAERLRKRLHNASVRAKRKSYVLQAGLQLHRGDDSLAVFSSLWYRAPSGNPRAIYEAALKATPEVHGVWIVRESDQHLVPPHYDVVTPNTSRYFDVLAKARYLINDVNFPTWWVKEPRQVHLQTQHGTPLKFMGLDLQRYPIAAGGLRFGPLMRRVDKWDYNLSSNSYSSEVWKRAFPSQYETLEYGYPRNDVLVNSTEADKARCRRQLGLPGDDLVVLYMPTFRDGASDLRLGVDLEQLVERLGVGVTVLVRGHYFYKERPPGSGAKASVIDVSSWPRVEDLYQASDLLISDYSSAMFDFANLGRPIVIHAYDWNDYRKKRGAYFDITEEAPGHVTTETEELAELIASGSYCDAVAKERLATFQSVFCEFDDGNAADRVVRRLFLDEEVEPPVSLYGEPSALRTWASNRSG